MNCSSRSTSMRMLVALGLVALGACTMVNEPAGGPPPPGRATGPAIASRADAPPPTGSARITSGVVDVAMGAIGTPYAWGGTTENGFDCSGLIQYAYGRYGIAVPRVSRDQMRAGTAVSPVRQRLREGDVLGFSESRAGRATHVGLYLGGGRFIHSSSSGVRVSSLDNPYWRQSLVAARRIVG